MFIESNGRAIFNFVKSFQTVFQVAVPFSTFSSNEQEFLLCNILSAVSTVSILDFSRTSMQRYLTGNSLMTMMLRIFHMLIYHLYIFSVEVSGQVFDLFFNWVIYLLLNFKMHLYTFDLSPLSDTCFADTFFQSYLFIFLTVSFSEKTFLI